MKEPCTRRTLTDMFERVMPAGGAGVRDSGAYILNINPGKGVRGGEDGGSAHEEEGERESESENENEAGTKMEGIETTAVLSSAARLAFFVSVHIQNPAGPGSRDGSFSNSHSRPRPPHLHSHSHLHLHLPRPPPSSELNLPLIASPRPRPLGCPFNSPLAARFPHLVPAEPTLLSIPPDAVLRRAEREGARWG